MNEFEAVHELYDVSVASASEVPREHFFELKCVWGCEDSGDEKDERTMCGTAGHIEDKRSSNIVEAAFYTSLKLFGS